ncbi:hypothetical protein JCM15764A_26260 [Geotalea toluenoxydans]
MYVEYSPLIAKSYLDRLYLFTLYLQKCIYHFWVKMLPPPFLDHSYACFVPCKIPLNEDVDDISHHEDPRTIR